MKAYYGYIYITENLINGKIYIGKRAKNQFDKNYYGSGVHLKNALKKYGKDNFQCEVLEWCITKEELCNREKYWIKYYRENTDKTLYNLAEGGDGGVTRVGYHHTEETKQKMSQSSKGKPKSELHKKHLSEAIIGTHCYTNGEIEIHSTECPEGFYKGRLPFSRRTKENMSKAHKGKTPHNKGVPCSEEQKQKISQSEKGQHWYNNGIVQTTAFECPEGYVPGMLKKENKKKMKKIRVYLASQIFAECWRDYNEKLAGRIEETYPNIELYVPQRNKAINDKTKCASAEDIAVGDFTQNLDKDDIVIAVVDGDTPGIGTVTEIGYFARMCQEDIEKYGYTKKKIISLYTDTRECSSTFLEAKNEKLHEFAECQYSYLNLLTVGALKRYGVMCRTIDQVIEELGKAIATYDEEEIEYIGEAHNDK